MPSAEAPVQRIDVHLSSAYKSLMRLLAFTSLGVGTLALWLSARSWPRVVDGEGITVRNGRRVLWSDLTDLQVVTVADERGRRVTGRVDLLFGKTKVKIVPHSLAEGQEVMDFIRRMGKGSEAAE